ncbi:energy transducer TonB family protein [Mangrovitalea sediminis]|uniref:energy transducer TonB family protein n=1 Tax=Mangrovitalea sediminis TaxID=1982043 RepID=UPI000BE5C351|nr:TonB family protein [Mangrovitalea sediminis]
MSLTTANLAELKLEEAAIWRLSMSSHRFGGVLVAVAVSLGLHLAASLALPAGIVPRHTAHRSPQTIHLVMLAPSPSPATLSASRPPILSQRRMLRTIPAQPHQVAKKPITTLARTKPAAHRTQPQPHVTKHSAEPQAHTEERMREHPVHAPPAPAKAIARPTAEPTTAPIPVTQTVPLNPAVTPATLAPDKGSQSARFRRDLERWVANHRRYPKLARLRGWQGQVRVRARMADDGSIRSLSLEHSCGYPILDREALKLIQAALEAVRPPAGAQTLTVPVDFVLSG